MSMNDHHHVKRLDIDEASPTSDLIPAPGVGFRNVLLAVEATGQNSPGGSQALLNVNVGGPGGAFDFNIMGQSGPSEWVTVKADFPHGCPAEENANIGIIVTLIGSPGNQVKGFATYRVERVG